MSVVGGWGWRQIIFQGHRVRFSFSLSTLVISLYALVLKLPFSTDVYVYIMPIWNVFNNLHLNQLCSTDALIATQTKRILLHMHEQTLSHRITQSVMRYYCVIIALNNATCPFLSYQLPRFFSKPLHQPPNNPNLTHTTFGFS